MKADRLERAIRVGIVLYVVAGVGLAIFGVPAWGIPGESHNRGIYAGGYDESPAARGVPFWQHVKNQLFGAPEAPPKDTD